MPDVVGWIEPQGTITLYGGVSWDREHQNAFYFTTQAQLDGYLNGSTVSHYTYTRTQYTRIEGGVIKLRDNEGRIGACNYLSFNNGSTLNNKTYYAFIDYTEYDSNNCVIVHYSIDYLTTYWLDMVFDHCHIIRQHTPTDKVGEHTAPEPISFVTQEVAETKKSNINTSPDNTYGCVIASSRDTDGKYSCKVYYRDNIVNVAGMAQGVYQGLCLHCYTSVDIAAGLAETCIKTILSDSDATTNDIVYVLVIPDSVIEALMDNHTQGRYLSLFNFTVPNDLGGYKKHTVRNKKLYTSQFTYLVINAGNSVGKYYLEHFSNHAGPGDSVTFGIYGGSLLPDCSLTCYPQNYEGLVNNLSQGVSLGSYPCATWANVLDNTGREEATSILGALVGGAMVIGGVALKNPTMVTTGAAAIGRGVSGAVITNTIDRTASGGNSNGTQDLINDTKEFYFRLICPSFEDCERIDKYFDMYGYAIDSVAVPNFNARPHYTYIQLDTVNVRGLMPEIARDSVIEIMRRGCTFWNNATEVGNYNLNNTV